jgi:hypothetical protein
LLRWFLSSFLTSSAVATSSSHLLFLACIVAAQATLDKSWNIHITVLLAPLIVSTSPIFTRSFSPHTIRPESPPICDTFPNIARLPASYYVSFVINSSISGHGLLGLCFSCIAISATPSWSSSFMDDYPLGARAFTEPSCVA